MFSINGVEAIGYSEAKQNKKLDLNITLMQKYIQNGPQKQSKNVKHLEENRRQNLCDPWLGKAFLGITQKR